MLAASTTEGSKYDVNDKCIEKLYKTGIVDKAISMSSLSQDKDSKKTDWVRQTILVVNGR